MMDAEQLVKENNKKRKLLTKENLKYYEDMLVYVRLSFDLSEQELEETLMEILDHLLDAQEDGKTAKEVFGPDPKKFANEMIGALPQMVTPKRIGYVFIGILYFLGAALAFDGIVKFVTYAITKDKLVAEVYIGTTITNMILSIPIAFLLVYLLILLLRYLCFKYLHKVLEFFIYWVYGIVSVGLFLIPLLIMPDFGTVISVHALTYLLVGISLFVTAYIAGILWAKILKNK